MTDIKCFICNDKKYLLVPTAYGNQIMVDCDCKFNLKKVCDCCGGDGKIFNANTKENNNCLICNGTGIKK